MSGTLCACGHPKHSHADCGTGPCRSNVTLALWHDSNDRIPVPCKCRGYFEPFVLTLVWTCSECGWTRVVDAPGFAGDGKWHYPDGWTPCGPISAQKTPTLSSQTSERRCGCRAERGGAEMSDRHSAAADRPESEQA